ncbi:hypothetical protein Lfu02_14520 [Longispora fulva]|uniref:DUF1345 domain-containing protein n=1 Tax=Longispora fulva TaxID=619741 RepID=A0A8J7KZ96_9ACTN|nr:hypothetical protein [Longispora fulva]MBG6140537.1 hypothetical protein [Longispora fulva]GIG57080.1 hypothetical protein Lfu02_14520 [Longispora fulva]
MTTWTADPHPGENRLAASAAVAVMIAAQVALSEELTFQPWWLLPGVECVLLVALFAANPTRFTRESKMIRTASLGLIGVASLITAWAAGRLVWMIATGHAPADPPVLLLNGAGVWVTNVVVFALWFWELDRGGPAARSKARCPDPDFLFPQMATPNVARKGWHPQFLDYLYVSFTNAAAFSPTDTMPLSRWAKFLMMGQSAVSLITAALVVARAVNILR